MRRPRKRRMRKGKKVQTTKCVESHRHLGASEEQTYAQNMYGLACGVTAAHEVVQQPSRRYAHRVADDGK
jgi:hypothetical protein